MVEAERQLAQINATALGSGHVPEEQVQRALNQLEHQAGVPQEKPRKPTSLNQVAALGITVTEVSERGET